ncbi:MAG: hypothetical protein LKF31_05875 [Muribaculaceae bacterium]|nr:hypothetical protein [Muribaculaceae bacterium]
MPQQPILNEHNKAEFPPMHTAEHILNGTMVKMFGCKRAQNAHVERTKSKLDYSLPRELSPAEIAAVEAKVNEVIALDLPVTMEFVMQNDVAERFDLNRLPDGATATVRIVHVGDYDECLCAGTHVARTSQIGHFRISSARFQNGVQRIVFRLDAPDT